MEKTTSIKRAVDRIKRHPMLQDIPFETVLDYLVDFIGIVGTPMLFEEKTAILNIQDYRALLPCDYESMIQVRTARDIDVSSKHREHIAYRYATDSFHLSPDKPDVNTGQTDFTYKIQGSIIYTSTKDEPVEIVYRAIAVDGEGYPLIPDNPSFLRAFDSYVKKEWFKIQFDMGRIPLQVFQQALQDYAWAVGDCETEAHRLSLDKAESLFNSWRTLVIRDSEHRHGFINNGAKEYLTLQP